MDGETIQKKKITERKLITAVALVLIFLSGSALGFYISSQTVNPRASFPSIFSRALTFLVKEGEIGEEDLLYHDTNLADFIVNGSGKTKIKVEGIVDQVTGEPDGDYHVVIHPQYISIGLFLVTEFIPEIDLPIPQVGDNIRIWGITRFDEPHNWWEIHPVIGWEKI